MKSPSVLLPGINHMNGLNHNALTCSAVPIPPWERPLQTVEAQPYFNVSQASLVLEGIVFDRNNNLLFVDVATGRVFKLTPERQLSIVLKENSFGASGLAVHKDGRIYPDSHTSFGVPSFIASNYVCDRVLHWYEGNQHAPLNGVMSFFHK